MNKVIKNILKILLIGFAATIIRIIGQLSIPAGEQTVLAPSIFAQNGTMPLVFTVYGIFAYSLIAALFLLIRDRMVGNRILQGLKYGLVCCAVWIVYLLEPLPHVAALDRITYPIADSVALIIMGLMLGMAIWEIQTFSRLAENSISCSSGVDRDCLLLAGRMIQYFIFDTYSSFDEKTLETVLWCLLTGIAISCVMCG